MPEVRDQNLGATGERQGSEPYPIRDWKLVPSRLDINAPYGAVSTLRRAGRTGSEPSAGMD